MFSRLVPHRSTQNTVRQSLHVYFNKYSKPFTHGFMLLKNKKIMNRSFFNIKTVRCQKIYNSIKINFVSFPFDFTFNQLQSFPVNTTYFRSTCARTGPTRPTTQVPSIIYKSLPDGINLLSCREFYQIFS